MRKEITFEGKVYKKSNLELSIELLESDDPMILSIPNRKELLKRNKELLEKFIT